MTTLHNPIRVGVGEGGGVKESKEMRTNLGPDITIRCCQHANAGVLAQGIVINVLKLSSA